MTGTVLGLFADENDIPSFLNINRCAVDLISCILNYNMLAHWFERFTLLVLTLVVCALSLPFF